MQMGHSMIKQVSGDILLSKARLIAHGVAPNDDHAQGLAHSLREYAPAMYKDFRHYCKTLIKLVDVVRSLTASLTGCGWTVIWTRTIFPLKTTALLQACY